jgi:hypothetical protein
MKSIAQQMRAQQRLNIFEWHEKKKLTPTEEEVLQLYFQLTPEEELQKALELKEKGEFSKLAMLYDITMWWDSKKYVTEKQYEVLKKNIFSKEAALRTKIENHESRKNDI